MNTCKHCYYQFEGKYCTNCGEKVRRPEELTLRSLGQEFFAILTNLDNQLFSSLRLLFLRPGELSRKYIEGIRIPYLKPIQLFLLANIVFFLFLSDVNIFRTPSSWYFQENVDGINVLEKVKQLEVSRNLTREKVAMLYDQKSSMIAKGAIVLLIPFIAFICQLLHIKKRIPYPQHVIFATHYFTSILLISVLVSLLVEFFFDEYHQWLFIVPISLMIFLYFTMSIKRFYNSKWPITLVKSVIGFFVINALIQLYRASVSYFSLLTL